MDLSEYKGKRIAVLGGTGLIGTALSNLLRQNGAIVSRLSSYDFDLRIDSWLYPDETEIVFNCAGKNGGIQFNLKNPLTCFVDNSLVGINAIAMAAYSKIPRIVSIVASCGYPDGYGIMPIAWEPSPELLHGIMCEDEYVGKGPPADSVISHGLAKRNVVWTNHFANLECGITATALCVPTIFGLGSHWDPVRTKVVEGMVMRFVDAVDEGVPKVTCWGSGSPLREIIFADDAAKLIAQAGLVFNDCTQPLNIGLGQEFSVRQIATEVAKAAGYTGSIQWDNSRPDGQYRKRLDLTTMAKLLKPIVPTPLAEALRATVEDYRRHKKEAKS